MNAPTRARQSRRANPDEESSLAPMRWKPLSPRRTGACRKKIPRKVHARLWIANSAGKSHRPGLTKRSPTVSASGIRSASAREPRNAPVKASGRWRDFPARHSRASPSCRNERSRARSSCWSHEAVSSRNAGRLQAGLVRQIFHMTEGWILPQLRCRPSTERSTALPAGDAFLLGERDCPGSGALKPGLGYVAFTIVPIKLKHCELSRTWNRPASMPQIPNTEELSGGCGFIFGI